METRFWEIFGEVEQGLGVVLFPLKYMSKSNRKKELSLINLLKQRGIFLDFCKCENCAKKQLAPGLRPQLGPEKHPLHRWVVSPSTQYHRFIDSASLFLCISHVFTVGSNSKLRPWPPFSEIGCFICAPVCQRGATGADGVGLCLCHNVWAFRRKKRQIC